ASGVVLVEGHKKIEIGFLVALAAGTRAEEGDLEQGAVVVSCQAGAELPGYPKIAWRDPPTPPFHHLAFGLSHWGHGSDCASRSLLPPSIARSPATIRSYPRRLRGSSEAVGAASSNPAARWSVLHGVVDQVGQDLLQAVGDHATNIAEM